MVIELSDTQAVLLREVLETRLGNLSSEIRHTDSPQLRQELRAERDDLHSMLDALAAAAIESTRLTSA